MKEAMKDFIIPSWKIFQLQIQEIILYWNSLTTSWIHHVIQFKNVERGLTHSVPLKARLKLYCTDPEHEDFETIVQDVYLGTIPHMTPSGTL
jgi:DNA-directed RNA polymerase beta subunit